MKDRLLQRCNEVVGLPPEKAIPELLKRHGGRLNSVSLSLGVNRNSIRYWIRRHPDLVSHLLPPDSKLIPARLEEVTQNGEE